VYTARPILFAHRGGRAHAPENTLAAFRLAVRLGATGLESDVWCTLDGTPVLHHDGRVGRRPRRRLISSLDAAELPDDLPTLADLLTEIDTDLPVSLDVKDPVAAAPTIRLTAEFGGTARLWLCHPDHALLASWRDLDSRVRLVHSSSVNRIVTSLERHAVDLAASGVDGINLPESDWSTGLVALFRRFGLACFGWDAQHRRQIDRLVSLELDAIYGDHVDRLVDGLRSAYPGS
jgi:glycerophosphoryl diester phosphodiesterase